MGGDSLVRRVLAGLVSPVPGPYVRRPRDVAGYPLSRRVLAGLFGVTLPVRPEAGRRADRVRSSGRAFVLEFSRVQASAAHGAGPSRPVEKAWDLDDETTVRCHNRPGLDQIEITLFTTRADRRDVLLPLRVDGTGYLMLVAAVGEGAEGRVIAPAHGASARIEFEPAPRALSSLGPGDLEEVSRSVNGSSSAALDLWRKDARRRPEDDPLRAAIVAALP
jgi:hypothetical protein